MYFISRDYSYVYHFLFIYFFISHKVFVIVETVHVYKYELKKYEYRLGIFYKDRIL